MFESLTLNWIRYLILVLRGNLFQRDEPETMDLRVDMDVDKIRKVLGHSHFTDVTEMSYYYKGEDLNLARPKYIEDEWIWYQIHVRAWEREGEPTELSIHQELDPTMYPDEHLEGVNYSKEPAVSVVHNLLEESGYDVERLD